MRMASRTTNTKSQILNAARSLYSTHGFSGTSLGDIITAAGITKGAFYHYFKGTARLCEEILDEVIADYRQLAQSIDPAQAPIEQLRYILETLAKLNASGEWVNCRLILRLSTESHQPDTKVQDKLAGFWKWYMDFFEDLILKCRAAGAISTQLDPKTQTRLLLSILTGTITLEKISPGPSAFTNLADLIINSLVG
jgi:TetR/AcrR family transcriptional repressor of nem operon